MKRFKNILIAVLLANIYYDACVGTMKAAVVGAVYVIVWVYMILKWLDRKHEEN